MGRACRTRHWYGACLRCLDELEAHASYGRVLADAIGPWRELCAVASALLNDESARSDQRR